MANRHQRRKRKALKDAQAAIFREVASEIARKESIIKANLSGNRGKTQTIIKAIKLCKDGTVKPVTERRKVLSPSYGTDSSVSVQRNAGPSRSASGEIDAMLRKKGYTVR